MFEALEDREETKGGMSGQCQVETEAFLDTTHINALQGMVKSVVTSSSTTMGSRQQQKKRDKLALQQ